VSPQPTIVTRVAVRAYGARVAKSPRKRTGVCWGQLNGVGSLLDDSIQYCRQTRTAKKTMSDKDGTSE
jgi:hypothetical protein